jgi:hypothetical protein
MQTQSFSQDQTKQDRLGRKSLFNKFFVAEDGVISLSLRDMTLVGCGSITVALLFML